MCNGKEERKKGARAGPIHGPIIEMMITVGQQCEL